MTLVTPECFAGLSAEEREAQMFLAITTASGYTGLDPDCYPGLSPAEKRYYTYAAVFEVSVTAGLVDPACFLGLSREEQDQQMFAAVAGIDIAPPVAPELVSATIDGNGTTFSLVFNEIVQFGAGGNAGWTITPSGAAATLAYTSGAGTTTLVYTISRTIASIETATVNYMQPGNGVENAGGADLASIVGGSVTNNSVQQSETADWQAAVIANGGTVSPATMAAVNTRIVAAKLHGYWDLTERANWFCGDQLAACLVPVKVENNAPNLTDTNFNFVGGDYSEATGLTGNGTTKYLDTGTLANVLAVNDTHLGLYNRTNGATGGGFSIGAVQAGDQFNLAAPYSDGTVYSDQYQNAGGGRLSVAITGVTGSIIGTRISATDHKIYRNGASIATSANSGGALPARAIFVFAQNGAGTPGLFAAQTFAGYSIGAGLTAQQALDYATDEEVFQDALGRGVA